MTKLPTVVTWSDPAYTRPGAGDPPDLPPDPPSDGGTGTWPTLFASLFGVLRAFHNDQSGTVVANAGSAGDGALSGSSYNLRQPSLLTDDTAQSMMIRTGSNVVYPGPIIPAPPLAIFAAYQRLEAGDSWQNIWSYDEQISGVNQAWGALLNDKGDGGLRLTIRDGAAVSVHTDTAAGLVERGDIVATLVTITGAGVMLYVDSGTPAATNALVVGGATATDFTIGQWRSTYAPSRLNALIGPVGIRSGTLTGQNITDLMAAFKARVRWANEIDAGTFAAGEVKTVRVTDTAAFKGARTALTMSVVQQPNGASVAFDGNNDAVITAGSVAGDIEGLYSFSDANGSAMQPARIHGVIDTPTNPPPSGPYETLEVPFNTGSAWNIPIGSGAELESATDPATADFLKMTAFGMAGDVLGIGTGTYPVGGPFLAEASAGDTTYQVAVRPGENGINLPFSLKIPESCKQLVTTPSFPSGDRVVLVLNPNGDTVDSFYHFIWNAVSNRFEAGLRRQFSLSGLGHGTSPGDRVGVSASGQTTLAGNIIARILSTPGLEWPQVLMLILPRNALNSSGCTSLLSKQTVLPATTIDAYAETANLGAIPYGGVFTVSRAVTLGSLGLSEMGLRLGKCLWNRGMMAVDGGGCALANFRATPGVTQAQRAELLAQMKVLIPHMRMIKGAAGAWFPGQVSRGGGTPLAANYGIVP